jgi:hypothetical protein
MNVPIGHSQRETKSSFLQARDPRLDQNQPRRHGSDLRQLQKRAELAFELRKVRLIRVRAVYH